MPVEIHLQRGNGEVRLRSRLRQAPPVALVIFGASGDLARRKLVPALFDLHQAGLLGQHFAVTVPASHRPTPDPYLLGVAMRHFAGRTLPDTMDEPELLRAWLEARIARSAADTFSETGAIVPG